MTKTEQFQLTSRLASIQNRAGAVESEAREILNDLAAGLIPTTPEVTAEAAHQLKSNSMSVISRALSAVMEVAAQ